MAFNKEQIKKLEEAYQENNSLKGGRAATISQSIGLGVKQVQFMISM